MIARIFHALLFTALGVTASGAADAAPTLRTDVTVIEEIVTVGDMFDGAGKLADEALFRAPHPGTTGTVGIAAVRAAAHSVGLTAFGAEGITEVRVGRAATLVDKTMLAELVASELATRGLVAEHVVARPHFDAPALRFHAAAVAEPVRLLGVRYTAGNGSFAARFEIAGVDQPVDLTGRVQLLVEAPHLVASLPGGTVLGRSDIEMRLVPQKFAGTNGLATLDQLIGQELRQPGREGLLLRADDVIEPQVVKRNTAVTVIYHRGAMTLTVKGQALNSAAAGQPVQVLNAATRKVLHGVATPGGAVEMTGTLSVAGL